MSSPESNSAANNDTAPERTAQVRVLRQFRVIFNAVKTHFRQVEREAGIGGAQVWALSLIRDQPGIGVNELASSLDIHQSTASNLVKSLVERGLVETSRDESDRRTVLLRICPTGEDLLGKTAGPFSGVLPSALARLDADRLKRLEQDLSALISVLSADESAGDVPLAEL
jgi:DNA-binding MarR family transcriptional regulator